MKTGSFVLPRLLSSELVQKVAGGVNPNFNYQPAPQNYASVNITANGGSGPQYQYQVNTNLALSNVSVTGSITGNEVQAVTAGGINIHFDFK